MSSSASLAIILGGITSYGTAILTIVGAILVVSLGYLVFRFGIDRLLHDQSLMIGGFYLRNTPYKGYNRFRSKTWNMKNTM